MYVDTMRVVNWRNFTKAEVKLSETTYLIGPNASGKSNFLDVFRFMRDIVRAQGGGLQQSIESRGGLTKLRSLAARKNPRVELDFELRESLGNRTGEADWRYVLSIKTETGGKNRPVVETERVYRHGEKILDRPLQEDKSDKERLTQTHLEQITSNADFRPVAEFFEQVLYLHLVPQLLKFGREISVNTPESDPFGLRFLEAIAATPKKTRDSRLKKIEKLLQSVVPNFEQLRFVRDPVTGRPHLEMLYNHWRPNAGWQREDQFSDGTLRLVGLMWTLLTSNDLILLEEPELSLHTRVVEQIPGLIFRIRKQRSKSGGQLFISTHSEALLSSRSIDGNFLILNPGKAGESTDIQYPSDNDIDALKAGMTPADILLPQTSAHIGDI